MRCSILIAVMAAFLCPMTATGQTLEEAHASLCEPGRQSEACDALRQLIAERSAATDGSLLKADVSAEEIRVWGPLARLVGTTWVHQNATGIDMRHAYTWSADRSSIRLQAGMPAFANADRALEFRPGDQPGELKAHIVVAEFQGDAVFRFQDDMTLRAEPYVLVHPGGSRLHYNEEMALGTDGVYLAGLASVSYPMVPLAMKPLTTSGSEYEASQRRRGAEAIVETQRKIEADLLAVEEAKRDARRQRWSAVMGVLNGALDSGLEVAHAREAQSRYELDSTLAAVNAKIAAQQQATHAASRPSASAGHEGTSYAAPAAGTRPAAPAAATPYIAIRGSGTGSWASAGQGSSASGMVTPAAANASTRDDASTCVSSPVTSTHKCTSLSGYKAMVSNTCSVPVDIRICFMTASGWNCQSNYGVQPQGTWEPGWCHANTGEVFHSVRYSDSDEPLEQP